MALLTNSNFLQTLRARYSLRIHMTAILLATACSGVLASKLLLMAHVENFTVRYPLAVLISYLVFFACIKLWLVYVTPAKADQSEGSTLSNVLDMHLFMTGGGSRCGNDGSFHGTGGAFSGGGASADFGGDASLASESVASVAVADAASGATDGLGDLVGGAADADGGLVAVIVMAVLAIMLAAVLGASIYVIYQAPVILSEAALQGLMAATLTRQTKTMAQGDWIGSVFKTTWKPFVCTLALAFVGGMLLHNFSPHAIRLADIWK